MSLQEVYKPPFRLVSSKTFTNPTPQLRVKFKTKVIYDSTNKEEIFILSKMYFDNIVLQYKNYMFENVPTAESTYKLYVGIIGEEELEYKHIYSCFYNNIKDKIAWENKYDDNFEIEGKFFIGIDVSTYVIENYEDEDEDEEEYKIKTPIKEDECVICYENKANVLYTKCLHFAVCGECDKKGNFSNCPMCRIKINNQRILFS